MTPQQIEELQAEVMEDYILTAELGHLAKDQAKHKEELRHHWQKLQDHITTLLEIQREEIVKMIKNHPVEINGDREQVMNGLELIEKFSGDIIELIKEK